MSAAADADGGGDGWSIAELGGLAVRLELAAPAGPVAVAAERAARATEAAGGLREEMARLEEMATEEARQAELAAGVTIARGNRAHLLEMLLARDLLVAAAGGGDDDGQSQLATVGKAVAAMSGGRGALSTLLGHGLDAAAAQAAAQ